MMPASLAVINRHLLIISAGKAGSMSPGLAGARASRPNPSGLTLLQTVKNSDSRFCPVFRHIVGVVLK
jgi:hypothetical protein